jgi:hypothetical protein
MAGRRACPSINLPGYPDPRFDRGGAGFDGHVLGHFHAGRGWREMRLIGAFLLADREDRPEPDKLLVRSDEAAGLTPPDCKRRVTIGG